MSQNPQPDNLRGTARGMVILAWVAGLVFLTWLFQQVLDDRYNPNQQLMSSVDGQQREVRLQRNFQGHYLANGQIDGHPVTFLLDTGATDVAVSERLASALRLPRLGQAYSQTANGTVRVWRTRLDRVQLGPIEMRNVSATIVPTSRYGRATG